MTAPSKALLLKRLCLLCLGVMSFLSQAQRDHLDVRISIDLKQVSLKTALENIELKGGFYFSYNADYFNYDSLIDVQAEQKTVKKILNTLIPSTYSYKSIGQHIVIYRKGRIREDYRIAGYITDAFTAKPLHQVSVYNIGSQEVSLSQNGNYEILVAADKQKTILSFSKKGYHDKIVYVDPGDEDLKNIAMVPLENSIEGLTAKNIDSSYSTLESRRLVRWVVPQNIIINANNLQLYQTRPFQLSFLPFLGTNGRLSGTVRNNFSLNIWGGYSHSLRGLEVGGIFNINRKAALGTQIAGFFNLNGGYTRGIQVAGFSNYSGESTYGLQLAGMNNLTIGNMKGLQAAGFVNVLHGKMDGVQLSGFNNVSTYNVEGAQLTGFVNVAIQDVDLAQVSGFANYAKNVNGLQAAGFANIALKDVNSLQVAGFLNLAQNVKYTQVAGFTNISIYDNSGVQAAGFLNYAQKIKALQIAGFANIALEESKGAQISGFFNYAKYARGFQLAVFNYADSITSGIPIGLFSVVKNGLHRLELSADELFPANIALKSGVPVFYNILKAGLNQTDYHLTYGLGSSISIAPRYSVNLTLTYSSIWSRQRSAYQADLYRFMPGINYRLNDKFSITAGPSVSFAAGKPVQNADLSRSLYSAAFFDDFEGQRRLQMWAGGFLAFDIF